MIPDRKSGERGRGKTRQIQRFQARAEKAGNSAREERRENKNTQGDLKAIPPILIPKEKEWKEKKTPSNECHRHSPSKTRGKPPIKGTQTPRVLEHPKAKRKQYQQRFSARSSSPSLKAHYS